MKCPFCAHPDTQVLDTRVSEEGDAVRRRRRCESCDRRFTTYERSELHFPAIVKKDGNREEYNRNKLANSLQLALRKRPVPAAQVNAAILSIEERLLGVGGREIASEQIGQWVMEALRGLDKIAYVRFASVYQQFEDVAEFQTALKDVLSKPRR